MCSLEVVKRYHGVVPASLVYAGALGKIRRAVDLMGSYKAVEVVSSLSGSQKELLLKASKSGGRVAPTKLGDHSAARRLVRVGFIRQKWNNADMSRGADRIFWELTSSGRRAAAALAESSQ